MYFSFLPQPLPCSFARYLLGIWTSLYRVKTDSFPRIPAPPVATLHRTCWTASYYKIIDSSEYSDYSNYFEKLPQMLAYSTKKQ